MRLRRRPASVKRRPLTPGELADLADALHRLDDNTAADIVERSGRDWAPYEGLLHGGFRGPRPALPTDDDERALQRVIALANLHRL